MRMTGIELLQAIGDECVITSRTSGGGTRATLKATAAGIAVAAGLLWVGRVCQTDVLL